MICIAPSTANKYTLSAWILGANLNSIQHVIVQTAPAVLKYHPQLPTVILLLQGPKAGQPGCRFTDPGFQSCVQEVRRSLISATAATSLLACFLMGAVANLPLAVAPGMGEQLLLLVGLYYCSRMLSLCL